LRIRELYYNFVGNPDIIKYVRQRGMDISWVIEAGCHDGQDTLKINQLLQPSRIIAFEPDSRARLLATKAYAENNLDVELHNFGLSDKNSSLYLNFLNGEEGTGSTYLAQTGSKSVEVKRFNDLNLNLGYGGMLWLDVEGHAVQALSGASDSLGNLAIAKVEIQMHKMSESRVADYWEVNQLMHTHGLIPVRVPIYPGFFGDVIYLNKKESKLLDRLWSYTLVFQMKILHGFVYPALRKPKS
jgi:FkbM family methyltransferase